MRDINFLNNNDFFKNSNTNDKSYKKIKNIFKVSIAVIIISYGLLYGLELAASFKTKMIKSDIRQFSKVIELNENIDKYTTRMNDISRILEKSDLNGVMNSDLLKAIGESMPDKIVLLNYTTGEDSKISIEGKSSDTASISQFTYGLNNSQFFRNVELKTINESKNGKASEYTFLIELK